MPHETELAKDALAVEFGRRGGKARAISMSPEQRRDIARRAARARWAKKHAAPDPPSPTDPHGPERDRKYAEAGILSTPRRKPAVPASVTSRPEGRRAAA